MQRKEIRYYAEVKANVTKADKLLAMMRKGHLDHPLLLVTKYINPQLADELKQNGTESVDAAGTHLSISHYTFSSKEQAWHCHQSLSPKRTFGLAGLKAIYGFCNPGLENKTYRDCCRPMQPRPLTDMKELKELDLLQARSQATPEGKLRSGGLSRIRIIKAKITLDISEATRMV
jgi:hypothetical protein